MEQILAKAVLKFIACLQTNLNRGWTMIPKQQYSEVTKVAISLYFNAANNECEYLKERATECLNGYDWEENTIVSDCQRALSFFSRAQAMLLGSEADSYRVSFFGYDHYSDAETFNSFHQAFDILHDIINVRSIREGYITAVYNDMWAPCIEHIFSSAIYYESMDEVAKTKRRPADTEHIKEMAIQISDAQLYFDAVIFEHDRAAYRERRKVARAAARKAARRAAQEEE